MKTLLSICIIALLAGCNTTKYLPDSSGKYWTSTKSVKKTSAGTFVTFEDDKRNFLIIDTVGTRINVVPINLKRN